MPSDYSDYSDPDYTGEPNYVGGGGPGGGGGPRGDVGRPGGGGGPHGDIGRPGGGPRASRSGGTGARLSGGVPRGGNSRSWKGCGIGGHGQCAALCFEKSDAREYGWRVSENVGLDRKSYYRRRGFDDEMRALVARNLEGRGIILHPQTNLTQLVKTEDGIKVTADHGEELMADAVLFATGRIPNSKRLNLQAVGVEVDSTGAVKVDEFSRTNVPSIWAIGDVTNRMNLTPVALMEGTLFAKTVFGNEPSKPDYSNIPCAVFCIPPLSVVGLSEEQAIEQANGDILVFTLGFNPMKNSISGRQEKTLMKLIVSAETDKVLGASMCGLDAAEIMQGIAVALNCGATKAQFDSTVGIHPSSAEEFVTMRSVTRRIAAAGKPKTNL